MADMKIAENGRTYRYNTPQLSPGGSPLWPFGFGLSFTEFSLSYSGDPSLLLTPASPTIQLSVRVTNTGSREGDEVLQTYMSPQVGSLAPPVPPYTPIRSLIFFERLRLGAGQGEDIKVTLNSGMLNLTLSDGTRKPIDGNYSILFSRGVGEEINVPLTLRGW